METPPRYHDQPTQAVCHLNARVEHGSYQCQTHPLPLLRIYSVARSAFKCKKPPDLDQYGLNQLPTDIPNLTSAIATIKAAWENVGDLNLFQPFVPFRWSCQYDVRNLSIKSPLVLPRYCDHRQSVSQAASLGLLLLGILLGAMYFNGLAQATSTEKHKPPCN